MGRAVVAALRARNLEPVVADSRSQEGFAIRAFDRDSLRKAAQNCEGIIHLEWSGSIQRTSAEPHATNLTNTTSTLNVLEIARELRIPVIFSSSAAVYPGDSLSPVSEDQTGPRSLYGAMKLYAEYAIRAHCLLHDLPGASLRLFNVVGPNAKPFQIVPSTLRALLGNETIGVTGDGQQTRDFVHVDDCAEAIVAALHHPGLRGEAINIGSGKGQTILDIISNVAQIVEKTPKIECRPALLNECRYLVANIETARTLLNFSPGRNIESAIRACLKEF